jgi:zinc protease
MRRFLLAFLLAATSLTAAEPAKPRFDRAKLAIPYKQFVLANGLTLVVHEDHAVPLVGVNLWYHVGSRNEQRGKTGFAHLFEHFFFDGSENHPSGFREAMDDLGARNRNGTTDTDRTNFFEDVPTPALERTLYLEADRMGFLEKQLSKEMLERERGVVQNEKRQGENRPYGRVFDVIGATIYPYSHPYSWSTIGSMEDLNAASLEDVRQWYRTYYSPTNCVLALAGDITPEHALELVTKYFGGIPPGPPLGRLDEWVPRLDRDVHAEMEDRVPATRIYRIYNAPGLRSADVPLLELVAQTLNGSSSARLDRRLIYDKKLITEAEAGVYRHEIASEFVITATVKDGVDPKVVEREIDAIIKGITESGPTAAELQRGTAREVAQRVRAMERIGPFGGRAELLAQGATFFGKPDAYLDQLEAMANATPASVKAAAKRWLDAPHYTLVVKPFPKLAATKEALDRSQLPALGAAPEIHFPKVQRTELANGLKVMLLERHGAPLVNVTIAADAGFAADPPSKAGTASLALGVIDQGTATRNAFEIADALDSAGALLTSASDLDLSYVKLSTTSANLRGALDVFGDVVLHPAFAADMVDIAKKHRLSDIAQEKAQPSLAGLRVIPRLLYGSGHAYANPLTGLGYESSVSALTPADLRDWYRTWFRPNNATVVVTGDATMEQVKPELERVFGGWQRGDIPKKTIAAVPRTTGGKVYLIDQPGAPQSVIRVAMLTDPSGQPDDVARSIVMRDFGGMATSRLNRNLRLDKHWSYGAGAQLAATRGQRPFLLAAPVQTDKTKESMAEIAKELRMIAGEKPIAGEEFASILRNQLLGLPGQYETLRALDAAAFDMISLGYPESYFANYSRNVAAVNEEQLATAAKEVVRPEEAIWVVVGDLSRIEAGIRELNFGDIVKMKVE